MTPAEREREQAIQDVLRRLRALRFAGTHDGISADAFQQADARDARVKWLEGELYELHDAALQPDRRLDRSRAENRSQRVLGGM